MVTEELYILKKSFLWVLLSYMVVATYCYYKKECRTMHTAIVLYLLTKESQLNEVCLGHIQSKMHCVCQTEDTCTIITYDILNINLPLSQKDERESLKKLNTSPGINKSLFTTQQSKQKYFDSTVKMFKAKCAQSVTQINSDVSHVGFREERIRTVSMSYELSTL